MVYILSKTGQPLMPTKNHRMVRLLLREKKAKVVQRTPFTIQILITTHTYRQPISLGVDAGSKKIGISATTSKEELYASEVMLRTDVADLLSTRREFRRARRNRKTRYRKPRFLNRRKGEGWLAPTIRQKIHTHLQVIANIHKILPINNIVIETAAFDVQKIKNPSIHGKEYQQGDQLGFWNVREYVLWRDGHQCQCCHGKRKDPVLNVHHIESRKTGGNAPNNLITLCKTCHSGYHNGSIQLPKRIKRGMSFRDAAFMGIMRWAFYNELKKQYPKVSMTFGYVTKNLRIVHNLEKSHIADARCISGHPLAQPATEWFFQKAVRKRNRQLHRATIGKHGKRKANQAPKYVFGYQLFDKVLFHGKEAFVFGRRRSGSFDIRTLDGTKLSASVSYKKLKKLEGRKTLLVERMVYAIPPTTKVAGILAQS